MAQTRKKNKKVGGWSLWSPQQRVSLKRNLGKISRNARCRDVLGKQKHINFLQLYLYDQTVQRIQRSKPTLLDLRETPIEVGNLDGDPFFRCIFGDDPAAAACIQSNMPSVDMESIFPITIQSEKDYLARLNTIVQHAIKGGKCYVAAPLPIPQPQAAIPEEATTTPVPQPQATTTPVPQPQAVAAISQSLGTILDYMASPEPDKYKHGLGELWLYIVDENGKPIPTHIEEVLKTNSIPLLLYCMARGDEKINSTVHKILKVLFHRDGHKVSTAVLAEFKANCIILYRNPPGEKNAAIQILIACVDVLNKMLEPKHTVSHMTNVLAVIEYLKFKGIQVNYESLNYLCGYALTVLTTAKNLDPRLVRTPKITNMLQSLLNHYTRYDHMDEIVQSIVKLLVSFPGVKLQRHK